MHSFTVNDLPSAYYNRLINIIDRLLPFSIYILVEQGDLCWCACGDDYIDLLCAIENSRQRIKKSLTFVL